MNKPPLVNSIFKISISVIIISGIIFQRGFGQSNSQLVLTPTLEYLGHAFVKLKTLDDKVIYVDPYGVDAFADSADIVLITHEHGDHNQLYRVKQKVTCQVIRSSDGIQSGIYQTFTIDNVTVQAVAAYNQNHNKNTCVGYVIEFDGIKLYHAGDTGKIPEMDSLASQNLDYALLPMEGIYTITPEVASEAAAVIMAKHDIPIHTMTTPDTYSDEFVARFTSPNKLVVHPGEVIDLVSVSALKEESNAIAYGFILNQNYPNPFNPSSVISYQLAVNSKVSLKIYDVTGREIITLVNEEQTTGLHSVVFDGSNFASGIYFYKLVSSSGLVQIRKMILLN